LLAAREGFHSIAGTASKAAIARRLDTIQLRLQAREMRKWQGGGCWVDVGSCCSRVSQACMAELHEAPGDSAPQVRAPKAATFSPLLALSLRPQRISIQPQRISTPPPSTLDNSMPWKDHPPLHHLRAGKQSLPRLQK
jgi:hypothetical protein